jgi:hypothetical protein
LRAKLTRTRLDRNKHDLLYDNDNAMRTKQSKAQAKASATPKLDFKSQLNGTPKSTTTSKARANSLQPTELSAEYWTLLRDWLNAEDNDHPFEVHTVPLSKKRKRSNNKHLQVQDDLFQERLTVQYKVEPKDKWESLRRYKKFTGREDQELKRTL